MKTEYQIFNTHKSFVNFIKEFDLFESLYVIWAYIQNLQFDTPMPRDIELNTYFNKWNVTDKRLRNSSEWELEYLTKEIILNCERKWNSKKSLRQYKYFTKAVNNVRKINDLTGSLISQADILKELYRMAHRQFIWQSGVNSMTMIRNYKIYNNIELRKIFKEIIGIEYMTFFKIGLLFWSHYSKSYFVNYPVNNNKVKDIPIRDIDMFTNFYLISINELKNDYKMNQSFDENIFYKTNPLKYKPLILNNNIIICPLPTLLFWQFTSGVYYLLIDKNIPNFDNLFGFSFQIYVGDVIKEIDNAKKFNIYPEEEYSIKKGNNKKTLDWIIEDNDAVMLIECKTKRIKLNSKILLSDNDSIESDINIITEAITQLYRGILDFLNNLYPQLKHTTKKIYPTIVTLEEWYLVNYELHEKIIIKSKEKLNLQGYDSDIIDKFPFTVFSINEFEIEFQKIYESGIEKYMKHRFNIHRDDNIDKILFKKLFFDNLKDILNIPEENS